MAKDAVTVTIDRYLHDWIKEKGGNKSRVVNRMLTIMWQSEALKPVNKRRESPLHRRRRNFEAHMKQLNAELDQKELLWDDEE